MKEYKRISIIGPNGAGKSTIARVLGEKLSLPVIHMDTHIWGENWTLNSRDVAENKIKDLLLNQKSWIAEGYINYAPKEMLELPDLVIYLNYKNTRAFVHNIKRWIKHRKNKREELAEGCEEKFSIKSLYHVLQGGVVHYIEDALLKYPPSNLIRLKSPSQLKNYINNQFN